MKIQLEIRQEDIDDRPTNYLQCVACPIAKAINRKLQLGFHARVGYTHFYVYGPHGSMLVGGQPPDMVLWRNQYDNHEPVTPTAFEIKVPDIAKEWFIT